MRQLLFIFSLENLLDGEEGIVSEFFFSGIFEVGSINTDERLDERFDDMCFQGLEILLDLFVLEVVFGFEFSFLFILYKDLFRVEQVSYRSNSFGQGQMFSYLRVIGQIDVEVRNRYLGFKLFRI